MHKIIYIIHRILTLIVMFIYYLLFVLSIFLLTSSILTIEKDVFVLSTYLYSLSLFFKTILFMDKSITIKEPPLILYLKLLLAFIYSSCIGMMVLHRPEGSEFVRETFDVYIYIAICILVKSYYYFWKKTNKQGDNAR